MAMRSGVQVRRVVFPRRSLAFAGRQRGVVAIIAVIALLSILTMTALALEGGRMTLNKTRLQNAVDAAALSAAKVYDETKNATLATSEAKVTFGANVGATGNADLVSVNALSALTADGGGHWQIQYLSSLNPVVVEAPTAPVNPIRFVRVTLSNVQLNTFLGGVVNLDQYAVRASAVAGPSPPLVAQVCDLTPMLVCAKSPTVTETSFYGFTPGSIQVMKIGSSSTSPLGEGNYQLLDLNGSGARSVREAMAGSAPGCYTQNELNTVVTQPGNEAGPVAQGLNTRFGIYQGGMSSADGKPDLVTVNPQVNATKFGYDVYTSTTTLPANPYRYSQYQTDLAGCMQSGGSRCDSSGEAQRRVLTIVVGDCTGVSSGVTQVKALGFGCFFLPQSVKQQGSSANVYGEFVKGCTINSGGFSNVPPTVQNNTSPTKIILYKDPDSRDA